MISLLYVSSATHLMSDAELVDLLNVARHNNQNLNVTGILLYQGGNFMQVLEGEEAAVQALYEKIAQDRRHSQVIQLLKMPIQERTFTDWSMGFMNLSNQAIQAVDGYNQFLSSRFDAANFNTDRSAVKHLLLRFREMMN